MLVFLIILSLFIFMVLVLHSSARIYRHYVFKQAKISFNEEPNLLNSFYDDYIIIIAERLVEVSGRNSGSKFPEAHENQSFAINSLYL